MIQAARNRARHRRGPVPRRGTVLVAALVCLLVVMSILTGILQNSLRARRQLRAERDARQADLLLEAGLSRAQFQLARNAEYRGEVWDLPADQIVDRGEAAVTIQANPAEEPAVGWKLQIRAEYPRGNESSIRRSATILIPPQSPNGKE